MEDAVTEPPPPSRFFEEDLDTFSPRSPPLPSPFLLLRNPRNPQNPKNPNLLIVAISPTSLSLLRSIPNQTLAAALFLPEHPLLSTSPIQIHSSPAPSLLLASVPCHVSPSRSRAVARLLLDAFPSDRVLVLDSIRPESYRGRLSAEEASAFKLETGAERKGMDPLVKGMEYLGSGSVADGLGAALMAECEMRRRKGTMVVTWPEDGRDVAGVLVVMAKGLGVEVGEGFTRGGGVKTRSDLYL